MPSLDITERKLWEIKWLPACERDTTKVFEDGLDDLIEHWMLEMCAESSSIILHKATSIQETSARSWDCIIAAFKPQIAPPVLNMHANGKVIGG